MLVADHSTLLVRGIAIPAKVEPIVHIKIFFLARCRLNTGLFQVKVKALAAGLIEFSYRSHRSNDWLL